MNRITITYSDSEQVFKQMCLLKSKQNECTKQTKRMEGIRQHEDQTSVKWGTEQQPFKAHHQ